jgi:gliding motility-associated-like protein
MKLILSILFISYTLHILAQKQGNNWFFGNGAGVEFVNGNPVPLNTGQTTFIGCPACHAEGTAVMSDSSGALLMYSDGNKLWNRNHQIMPNGNNLLSNISATQSSLIVPRPGSDSLYYIFNVGSFYQNGTNPINFGYSVVNMCLNSGLGDVVLGQKNIPLLSGVTEKLTGVRHANGVDYWILVHAFNSNAFYAYLLTSNGIQSPAVISNTGSVHTGSTGATIGQMKASPNGQKIAIVNGNSNTSIAEYFNFNNSSGVVSNPVSLQTNPNWHYYGVSFSPDNTKLYISCILNGNGLYQFDLTAGGGSPSAVLASRTQIAFTFNYLGLQLANNGKIYVARSPFSTNTILSVINNPNLPGASCNFVDAAVNLNGNVVSYGFPNFIDSYDYSNGIPICSCITSSTTTVSNCSSYSWTNGITYTQSGTYTQVLTNAAGCDSIATLNLSIGQSSVSNTTRMECDSYTWTNGITYTQTGTYTQLLTNSSGCDSIATLDLTILSSSASITNIAECNNFTWTNGITYTQSGTYTQIVTNATGCDSTATLNLTIFAPSVSITNTADCNSFTWTNGIAYTQSGTYIQNLTNVNGCDSVATLNLIIGETSSSSSTMLACDSYTWTNGTAYTQSGTYSQVLTNSTGCDSTATLNLMLIDGPLANFITSDETLWALESNIFFENTSQDYTQSSWFINGVSVGDSTDLSYNIDLTVQGDFAVTLIVTNDFCVDSITKTVFYNPEQLLYVPNAFSPNGDELNTIFLPVFSYTIGIDSYSLSIYNRWGELIFSSQDPKVGWDGTYKNYPVPSGSYVWKINVSNTTNSDLQEVTGHVILLR